MSVLTNDIDNTIQEIKDVPAKPKRVYRKKGETVATQPTQPVEIITKKQTKPPTEKQLASRAAFKDKVVQAKQLQAEQPGLTYKQAINIVYGKQ